MDNFEIKLLVSGPLTKSGLALAFVHALNEISDEGFRELVGESAACTRITLKGTVRLLNGNELEKVN